MVSMSSHTWLFQGMAETGNGLAPSCLPTCDLENITTCYQPAPSKPTENFSSAEAGA